MNIGTKTNDQIILDINQAMLEFWSSDSKKGQWPKYATKVDSVLEDNTAIESVGEVEYTNCVTTKKKLSTLTQENCNNLLSSTQLKFKTTISYTEGQSFQINRGITNTKGFSLTLGPPYISKIFNIKEYDNQLVSYSKTTQQNNTESMQYELDQTITVIPGQYIIVNVSAVQSKATCKFKNLVKISGCYKMQYIYEAHYFW